ncbi:prepilin peptidase [Hyphomonas sp.]|uniref:prepilin peptidase n=1 Tax=Hyphomonas sp. TaxID=87 RepID=UPI00391BED74
MTLLGVTLILAGLLIGSAIDAAAARFAREEAWMMPRSRCTACSRPLVWYELVPLLSWAALRGRCRTCRAPIGWSAPATEMAGALIAAAAVFFAPDGLVLFTCAFGWLLLALAAIDFRTFLLPDGLNAALLTLGAAMVALTRPDDWALHAAGAALGFGLLWSVETLYRRLRGRDGLGRGDAKLLGAIGAWVGITGIPPVLLIASLSGIAAALALSVRRSTPLSGQSAIAFGPWIALGGYAVWLLQPLLL